jgi:hypothetical protein
MRSFFAAATAKSEHCFGCALAPFLAVFIVLWPSIGNAQRDAIVQQCLKEMSEKGWAMYEYRNCVAKADKLDDEQSKQVKSRACNDKVCFYRLDLVSERTYRGQGYTLVLQGQKSVGLFVSGLTGLDGKQTVLEESCGGTGNCPPGPQVVSGPMRGATYKGPFGTGKTSYIVLQLPVTQPPSPAPDVRTGSIDCKDEAGYPCALAGRTIDYRFNIEGSQRFGNGPEIRDNRSIVERLKFEKGDDIYLFVGSDTNDLITETGYIYKFNQEIDFAVNRLRAPRHAMWEGVKVMNGIITLDNDALIRKYIAAGTREGSDWDFNWEVRIRFSKDFKTCSIAGFSWTGGNTAARNKAAAQYGYTLKQPLECTVR